MRCFLVLIILLLFSCNIPSSSTRAVDRLIVQFQEDMFDKYGLEIISIYKSCPNKRYTGLGVGFNMYKKNNEDQARVLLVEVVQEFHKLINDNSQLLKCFDTAPFPVEKLSMTIYFCDEKGVDKRYPNIGGIHLLCGEVHYHYYGNEDYQYVYPSYEEPYEEAVRKARQYQKTHDLARELQEIHD